MLNPQQNNIVESVQNLISGIEPDNQISLGYRLAEALRWQEAGARVEATAQLTDRLVVARAYAGDQPAAIFASSEGAQASQLLSDAALYAYHASISWGVAVDHSEAIVFNSHWIRDGYWYHLPPISFQNPENSAKLLEALTPQALTRGHTDSVAASYYEPDTILLPVDDALVGRLSYWRRQTLAHSPIVERLDEKLQNLFAQLFILRTVEDRRLAETMPPLHKTLKDSSDCDVILLANIFERAREAIEPDLFENEDYIHIPSFILAGIITDLYKPYYLPISDVKYDFSWIDADVLGSAYEKYLSSVLIPASSPSPQQSLFGGVERDIEEISVGKLAGVYYTPRFLVRYITERALDAYQNGRDLAEALPRIADFSCGSGSFLRAAADSLIRRLREVNPDVNWGRKLVEGRHLIGIDIDEKAVTLARMHVYQRLAEEPDPLPLPRLKECIVLGDSLGEEVWERLPDSYDIVLGNPPFLATGKVQSRRELSARFRTAKGRFDYSYLFVELGLNKLEDKGSLGLVVPNRLYNNRDAGTIREVMTQESDLLSVIDFGSNKVFPRANSYIGTIIAKKGRDIPPIKTVRYVDVKRLPQQYLGSELARAVSEQGEVRTDHLHAYDAPHPRGSHPWPFWSPSALRVRLSIEEQSERLSSLAEVWQGIRTGANDIFIAKLVSSPEEPVVQIRNRLGDVHVIESHMIRPMIYGADIRRYDVVEPSHVLVYPYRENNLISLAEIRNRAPLAFEYFEQYRSLLAARNSVTVDGLDWYALDRKRDESWLEAPKLLTKDLSTQTSFAVDVAGGTYLVGGTAVVPSDPDTLYALLGYLNSSFSNWYLSQMTPSFRGGYNKIEPQHLNDLPVPTVLFMDDAVLEEISELVEEVLEAKRQENAEAQNVAEKKIDHLLSERLTVNLNYV